MTFPVDVITLNRPGIPCARWEGGQVLPTHPQDAEPACLQCGHPALKIEPLPYLQTGDRSRRKVTEQVMVVTR